MANIGERITFEATLNGVGRYTDYKFNWQGANKYIYTFIAVDGTVYVWNTTSFIDAGNDSLIKVVGTIKGEGEYKGQHQIQLSRCKVTILNREKTYEERAEERAIAKQEASEAKYAAQMASLKEGDEILTVKYKAYKEHYADCETVEGSYYYSTQGSYIDVIVRAGRLVPSGTRGKTYSHYVYINELGEKITLKAIKRENAEKRLPKGHTWEFLADIG